MSIKRRAKYSALCNYKGYVAVHYKSPFPCFYCKELLQANEYEQHLDIKTDHNLNPKTQCPWCRGNVSWPLGEKYKNVDHILACVKSFFTPKEDDVDVDVEEVPDFDYEPEFSIKNFFGHKKISTPNFYDIIKDKNILQPRIITEISFGKAKEINRAKDIIFFYLENFQRLKFVHIMIRYLAIGSFFKNINEMTTFFKILPYYCFCKGGNIKEDCYRDHIHMIVVIESWEEFKAKMWNETRSESKPYPQYRYKFSKNIVSPLHLINTIGYVCSRKSRCNFGKVKSKIEHLNHFYLSVSFPKLFKYCLVLLWPEGLPQHLEIEFQNFQPQFNIYYNENEDGPVQKDCQWKIQYSHLPGLMDILRSLPIQSLLYFGDTTKMSIKKDLYRIKRKFFIFRPKIQMLYNYTKTHVDKVKHDKDKEIQGLKMQIDDKDTKIQDKDTEIQGLKRQIDDKDTENRGLKRQIDDKDTENRGLKRQIDDKDTEIQGLKRKIEEQKSKKKNDQGTFTQINNNKYFYF